MDNLLGGIGGVLRLFLVKETAILLINSIAIAGLTFGMLDMLMARPRRFRFTDRRPAMRKYFIYFCIFGPLWGGLVLLVISTGGRLNPNDGTNLGAAIFCALVLLPISAIVSKLWLKSGPVKALLTGLSALPVMLADGFLILFEGFRTIIHRMMAVNYTVFAVVINLAISGIIAALMGVSKDAGAANILGSLIGGGLHALIRRKKIKEIRAEYIGA